MDWDPERFAPAAAKGDRLELRVASTASADSGFGGEPAAPRRSRLGWLLRHVFRADVETCSHCGGPMRWVQAARESPDIPRLLRKHGLAPQSPPRAAPALLGQLLLSLSSDRSACALTAATGRCVLGSEYAVAPTRPTPPHRNLAPRRSNCLLSGDSHCRSAAGPPSPVWRYPRTTPGWALRPPNAAQRSRSLRAGGSASAHRAAAAAEALDRRWPEARQMTSDSRLTESVNRVSDRVGECKPVGERRYGTECIPEPPHMNNLLDGKFNTCGAYFCIEGRCRSCLSTQEREDSPHRAGECRQSEYGPGNQCGIYTNVESFPPQQPLP